MPASARLLHRFLALAFLPTFYATSFPCPAQDTELLCSHGSGSFEAEFHTGVRLRVGATKAQGRLAERSCEARLSWGKRELVVANETSQLDVDAFGADLGIGLPVVAFQIKKSDSQCCVDYEIYSLQKTPRLLRTITGGGFFSASDKDLDGRVEIWTNDAAAWDGFEHMVLHELDFLPTIVLRFEGGRLLDVSSEFRAEFDQEIGKVTALLSSVDLKDFKNSDGKLTPSASITAQQLHRLRGVKIKVLEIVWSYLYSGREPEAWQSLADMWPADDVDRIRQAITEARAHGIHAQVDGSSSEPTGRTRHASIFDTTGNNPEASRPQPIFMRRPAPAISNQTEADSGFLLDLLIDSAGKIRSVKLSSKAGSSGQDLLAAATEWKFVPAYKNGHPVASRLHLNVFDQR